MKEFSIKLLRIVSIFTLAIAAFSLFTSFQAYFGLLGDMSIRFQVFGFSYQSNSQDGFLNAFFFFPFISGFFLTAIGAEFVRNRILMD